MSNAVPANYVNPSDDTSCHDTLRLGSKSNFCRWLLGGRRYGRGIAGGGIVAGMPAGCAKSQMGAMLHMRQADLFRTRMALANDVRNVTRANSRKAWPRLSIWQGERDRTVDPGNAEALAAQWSELHGYGPMPTSDHVTLGVRRRIWTRPNQPPSVDSWTLKHQGHGFPVDPGTPGGGHVGAWLADAGLSAAQLITAFWGLEHPSRPRAASGIATR
jgi:poly(3-hydroxybutyrate) depolymerase